MMRPMTMIIVRLMKFTNIQPRPELFEPLIVSLLVFSQNTKTFSLILIQFHTDFIPSNNSLNGPMQTNDATMSNGKPKINGLPPSDDPMTFNETTSTIGPTLSDFIKTPTDRPQDESAIPDETKLLSVSDLHENTTKSTFECILPNTKEIQTISPDEKPTENLRTKATALEALAQNSEQLDSFARMEPKTPIKIGDIIAFKVFTPSLEISNYIIALVEVVHIPSDKSFDTINMDYDLTIEIMGRYIIYEYERDPITQTY